MDQEPIFKPSQTLAKHAHIDATGYEALYAESIADPDSFWAEHGKRIDWIKPYKQISDVSYNTSDLHISWGKVLQFVFAEQVLRYEGYR